MTKKASRPTPAGPDNVPGADESTQPATLVAGGPESEGKEDDAPAAPPPADAPPAEAPTPATHRKGVQPLSGTTD